MCSLKTNFLPRSIPRRANTCFRIDKRFYSSIRSVLFAKFRTSWEKPEPLTPGKETEINFTMPDLFHTFRRGHRIMVQVQSSWFPLTDRNPQSFTDIPYARPEQFQKPIRI